MLSFSIVESEVRDFMNKLLREDLFDFFEVRGVDIITFARFEIDGRLEGAKRQEPQPENGKDYCTWAELRPYVFGIIKGKRPRAFKIVLSLPSEAACALHANLGACFLNLSFDGSEVLCTAAVSEKEFVLHHTADTAWQLYIMDFFKDNKIIIRRN